MIRCSRSTSGSQFDCRKHLFLWTIERVEAYKGSASVLYSNYLSMDFAGNEAPLADTTNLVLNPPLTQVQAGSTGADLSKNAEYNLTADYRFTVNTWPQWAQPLWLRARWGRFEQKLGGVVDSTSEYHLILNYTVTFK